MISIAAAAAFDRAGASSPQASATASASCGRTRAPPGNSAWVIAAASFGGAEAAVAAAIAAWSVDSIRPVTSI